MPKLLEPVVAAGFILLLEVGVAAGPEVVVVDKDGKAYGGE